MNRGALALLAVLLSGCPSYYAVQKEFEEHPGVVLTQVSPGELFDRGTFVIVLSAEAFGRGVCLSEPKLAFEGIAGREGPNVYLVPIYPTVLGYKLAGWSPDRRDKPGCLFIPANNGQRQFTLTVRVAPIGRVRCRMLLTDIRAVTDDGRVLTRNKSITFPERGISTPFDVL